MLVFSMVSHVHKMFQMHTRLSAVKWFQRQTKRRVIASARRSYIKIFTGPTMVESTQARLLSAAQIVRINKRGLQAIRTSLRTSWTYNAAYNATLQ